MYAWMAFALVVAAFVTGCGGEKKSEMSTIKVACVNVQPTLDHTNGYDGWQVVRFGIGQTIVRYTDECEVVPWLCDYKGNRFTIKEGVKFTDGSKVTAKDICASFSDGTLKISFPKEETKKVDEPKFIEIN